MKALYSIIRTLTEWSKWVGFFTMTFTMFFVTYAAVGRTLDRPVIGDVELVQLGMVVMIMFGLAYSQAKDAHVAIGLIVDKFPVRAQVIIDIIAYTLTFAICMIITYFYFLVAMEDFQGYQIASDLLSIPLYPFKFMISLGFFLWGLEAVLKVTDGLLVLTGKTEYERSAEHVG